MAFHRVQRVASTPLKDRRILELARKDITVVVITGYDIEHLVASNAFATVKKPFTSAVLLDTLYQAANSAHHGAIATGPACADTRLPRTR